jgi:succinyl-diaminopimelate desuccinylase
MPSVDGLVLMDTLHTQILRDLVAFKTITPSGEDAINYCSKFLGALGFECKILNFGEVSNLYARFGNYRKNICLAGHVDVVPPIGNWNTNPFELVEKDGIYYGRGVNDMKGPLASALAAISDYISNQGLKKTSISVILTSDEEIMSSDGCEKVVSFLKTKDEKISGAILCESCSPGRAGEYIKTGCRGSLNVDITSIGRQCHVVNGKLRGNHLHNLVNVLHELSDMYLDEGSYCFTPSELEITSIDVGNDTRNIIPSMATAKLNIRFNDMWTFEKLEGMIKGMARGCKVRFQRFGRPIFCKNKALIDFLKQVISNVIGRTPRSGTDGGNSDAFSLESITDVVEIGSSTSEAHIENEFISEKDLIKLREIYRNILENFANFG